MMYFLTVVLIGTTYPIFLEVLTSEKISVGPPFYNKLIIPFLIPFLFAMAIGPKLKWIKSDLRKDKFYLTFIFDYFFITISLHNKKFKHQFFIKYCLSYICILSLFYNNERFLF